MYCTVSMLKILDIKFCTSKLAPCSCWAVAGLCRTGPKRLELKCRSCNVPERHTTWHPRCPQLGSSYSWFRKGRQTFLKRLFLAFLGGWDEARRESLWPFSCPVWWWVLLYRLSNASQKNTATECSFWSTELRWRLSTGRMFLMSFDATLFLTKSRDLLWLEVITHLLLGHKKDNKRQHFADVVDSATLWHSISQIITPKPTWCFRRNYSLRDCSHVECHCFDSSTLFRFMKGNMEKRPMFGRDLALACRDAIWCRALGDCQSNFHTNHFLSR